MFPFVTNICNYSVICAIVIDDKVPHLDCEKYRKYLEQVKIKESLKRQLAVDRERLRIMIGVFYLFTN